MVFPRRVITRAAGAGEDHCPVTEEEFAAIERRGGFAVHWDAHGLHYGIPREVAEAVHDGQVAVVNVRTRRSRARQSGFLACSPFGLR